MNVINVNQVIGTSQIVNRVNVMGMLQRVTLALASVLIVKIIRMVIIVIGKFLTLN